MVAFSVFGLVCLVVGVVLLVFALCRAAAAGERRLEEARRSLDDLGRDRIGL